jgi:hypothetical protein
MAAMTKSHRTARKATRMRVRVRAFIPCLVLGFFDAFGLLGPKGSPRVDQYLSS